MEGKWKRTLFLAPLALMLAHCGGGDSDSGGGGNAGATSFTGDWILRAVFNVNLGGTAHTVEDTTEVVVGASGNAVIADTDSECSLNVFVNNRVMTYETTCTFTATSDDASAPCSLTIRARGSIRGSPGNGRVSAPFGPDTVVCSGAAVSYSGNLVGSQGTEPDAGTDMGDGADDGMDNGDDG